MCAFFRIESNNGDEERDNLLPARQFFRLLKREDERRPFSCHSNRLAWLILSLWPSLWIAHQAQDWKIMQVINNKIRDDIVKKYAQYTKRVNGEMIKGKSQGRDTFSSKPVSSFRQWCTNGLSGAIVRIARVHRHHPARCATNISVWRSTKTPSNATMIVCQVKRRERVGGRRMCVCVRRRCATLNLRTVLWITRTNHHRAIQWSAITSNLSTVGFR